MFINLRTIKLDNRTSLILNNRRVIGVVWDGLYREPVLAQTNITPEMRQAIYEQQYRAYQAAQGRPNTLLGALGGCLGGLR